MVLLKYHSANKIYRWTSCAMAFSHSEQKLGTEVIGSASVSLARELMHVSPLDCVAMDHFQHFISRVV